MPSTVVKLCSGDARAWRVNQPVWLNVQGTVERAVTAEEQTAISTALSRTGKVEQSFRERLELKKPPTPGRVRRKEPPVYATFAFEVLWLGQRRVVNVYLDSLRYATGREVLSARLLADHGECILHGPNGKCMGVLRDPFVLERSPAAGRRVQWSKNPDDERLQAEKRAELDAREAARAARTKLRALPAAKAAHKPRAYSPRDCPNDCRGLRNGGKGWAIPLGATPPAEGEHHPTCMHAAAWAKTIPAASTGYVLYDLEQAVVMREALPVEVEEGRLSLEKRGVSQVQLQGKLFAVLTAENARLAALEARGEDPASAVSAPNEGELSPALSQPRESEPDERQPEERELAATSDTPALRREEWPMLGQLAPQQSGRRLQRRDHVSASDYLARTSEVEDAADGAAQAGHG